MVMVERWWTKWLIGKRMFNFEFKVMQELGYKEKHFFLLKVDLSILRNHIYIFWGYYLSNFCILISFQAIGSFLYWIIEHRKRTSVRNRFRYFFVLSINIEKLYIYLEDD